MGDTGKDTCQERMSQAMETLRRDLGSIRAGRAHPDMLSAVKVPDSGMETLLTQAATIGVEDARTLSVKPWDESQVEAIKQAILALDSGLDPSIVGTVVRVAIPPLPEEKRKTYVMQARAAANKAKTAVRNAQHDSEGDEGPRQQVRDLADRYTSQIDQALRAKEHRCGRRRRRR
ncbi:ribosome-recycling factor [Actinomadura nitritigenes]|uniref:ribosome-recycling factor n=1 Tax=Actinomadura nitritigenes TaxID=134602 RepID=UPI003D91803B